MNIDKIYELNKCFRFLILLLALLQREVMWKEKVNLLSIEIPTSSTFSTDVIKTPLPEKEIGKFESCSPRIKIWILVGLQQVDFPSIWKKKFKKSCFRLKITTANVLAQEYMVLCTSLEHSDLNCRLSCEAKITPH